MSVPAIVGHAHAKINLGLEILGRREDGLHEVATVLQTISLADRLSFTPADDLTLRCRGMRASPDNLILQAAHLLRRRTGTRHGCAIACTKRIPLAAGLGGGSADAGTTLRALNALWRCSLSEEELVEIAGELGADVPFAVGGGTALATGSGRTLAALPDAPPRWLALVPLSAPEGDKTREMYAQLTPADYTDGSTVLRQAQGIRAGRSERYDVPNAFFPCAVGRWPMAAQAAEALGDSGAQAVSLAGAGPSMFGLYESQAAATRGCARVRASGLPALRCRFVGRRGSQNSG